MHVRNLPGLLLAALALMPAAAAAQESQFGSVSISYRPVSAAVYVDGERWDTPTPGGPVVVQLLPGRHTVDVRAPQYRSFSTVIDVRRDERIPLNVSLLAGFGAPPPRTEAPPAPPQSPPGPIRQTSVSPSGDGFMIAPDFKITSIGHDTTGLAGVYGGAVFAGKLLVGAGAYWQLDSYYSEQLAYGGLVLEYRFLHDAPVGFNVNGLAGYGQMWGARPVPYRGSYYGYPYGPYEGFFIGEPQLQVVARFGRDVRLVGGVGYRFTSADFRSLDGVTGSFSIQFGR